MPEQQAEPRSSTVIVTGENRAEFMNRKLEIAAPPKAEEAKAPEVKAEKAEPLSEPKVEEKKEEKEKHPIAERISELTQKRKAAEERERQQQERADKAEKEAAELRAKLAPAPKQEEGTAPKRESFASDEEFASAVIDHRVELKLAERDKTQREASEKAAQDALANAWQERANELKKEIPDYDEIIGNSKVMVHNAVRDAIFDSDVGPRILVHLAQNEDEATKLSKMPLVRALKEIGKLEDRYSKPAAKAEPQIEIKAEPAKKEVQISKAPPPISPLKGASAPLDNLVDSKGNFTGTYKQFKELDAAGKFKNI